MLWVAVLLAAIGAGSASSSRSAALLARNRAESAKAEALADAGVHLAAQHLFSIEAKGAWSADRQVHRLALGEGAVTIIIEDEDGKIDLNAAPVELIAGLFKALGLPMAAAQSHAERIADFRDSDSDARPQGAEDDSYQEAGLGYGAADRPFIDVVELRRVLGMSQALYRRVMSYVTVHSRAEGLDPWRAAPVAAAALPGLSPEIFQSLLAAPPNHEQDLLAPAMSDGSLFSGSGRYILPSRNLMFLVRSMGETQNGGRFIREAIIEIKGRRTQPIVIHAWRRGDSFVDGLHHDQAALLTPATIGR